MLGIRIQGCSNNEGVHVRVSGSSATVVLRPMTEHSRRRARNKGIIYATSSGAWIAQAPRSRAEEMGGVRSFFLSSENGRPAPPGGDGYHSCVLFCSLMIELGVEIGRKKGDGVEISFREMNYREPAAEREWT